MSARATAGGGGSAIRTVIRSAELADYPDLVTAFGQREYFADRLGRMRHGLGDLIVAYLDGIPVGDVYLWCEPFEEPELRALYPGAPLINHLEVAPEHRSRGIGTALVRACEARARERGYDIVVIAVGTDNPRAKALYERLAFLDWNEGPIVSRWTEPDGHGGIRHAELEIDVLVRSFEAPHPHAWQPWHPQEVAARLAGVTAPWHVAGGWALDLFRESIGKPQMRTHEDLEIALPRGEFPALAGAFAGFSLFNVGAGALRPLRDGRGPHPDLHQVWVADMAVPAYRTDMFLEPGDTATWVCRRDGGITRPLADVAGRTSAGVPFLRPECVLLYKAKAMRGKDRADFAAIVPDLDAAARDWLADALGVAHPGHPWIAEIRGSTYTGAAAPGN